jgi:hypothetical protein
MQQGQVFELKKRAVDGSPVAEFVHPAADDSTADTRVSDGELSLTHPTGCCSRLFPDLLRACSVRQQRD